MKPQQTISEYDQQAIDFLESTGTTFDIDFDYNGRYFPSETEKRDIYEFTLKNERGEYTARFGDSVVNSNKRKYLQNEHVHETTTGCLKAMGVYHFSKMSVKAAHDLARKTAKTWKKPSAYDVLACLQGYEPPATFEDFCSEYGYNNQPLSEYPNVMKIYQAVQSEYRALHRMFTTEQLDQLAEIN